MQYSYESRLCPRNVPLDVLQQGDGAQASDALAQCFDQLADKLRLWKAFPFVIMLVLSMQAKDMHMNGHIASL